MHLNLFLINISGFIYIYICIYTYIHTHTHATSLHIPYHSEDTLAANILFLLRTTLTLEEYHPTKMKTQRYLPAFVLFPSSCRPTIVAIWERRKASSSSRAAIFLIAVSLSGQSFSLGLLCLKAGVNGPSTSCKGWKDAIFSSSSFFHVLFLWVEWR